VLELEDVLVECDGETAVMADARREKDELRISNCSVRNVVFVTLCKLSRSRRGKSPDAAKPEEEKEEDEKEADDGTTASEGEAGEETVTEGGLDGCS